MSSSPHLENLFTISGATDDLWPVIHGDKDAGDDDHKWSSSQAMSPILAAAVAADHQRIDAVLQPDHTIGKRIEELDSSKLLLEPVLDPSIEEGLMERILDYSIDDSLSAHLEDSDDIDLLLQESDNQQLPTMCEETMDVRVNDTTLAEPSNGRKGSIEKRDSSKTRGINYRVKQAHNGEETTMKKEEHNAKERIRRMKQHAAYLDLGALLPTDSSISKRRNSTTFILDRAVEYIPELEKEIQKLTLRKNGMLSAVKHKQSAAANHLQQLHRDPSSVSVHEIEQGEFIVQIFNRGHENGAFSNLLQNLEDEEQGMSIMSASTLQVSDHGNCYHLRIKMKKLLEGEHNAASLRERVISWFCQMQ